MTAAGGGDARPDERGPVRILFVFAWLVVGGEETEVRLLARHLDRSRFRIDVVACFRKEGMPEQTHRQLGALGVSVDRTPYGLPFEDTVAYLAGKMAGYDAVVACQGVSEVYPALERMHLRPPLIEHGGLVSEAEGPKHLTARHVGVSRLIRDAAAARMPGREAHALEIPSMVDPATFDRSRRPAVRRALGIADDASIVGWVGRLDRKKRVEDVIAAAALLRRTHPDARFVLVGGPDAFMPDYAAELRRQVRVAGLDATVAFLGDRADVPDLLVAFDALVWLSEGEGLPHVIGEAGAAGLPVVATPDPGALQMIADGETGLVVPHRAPEAAAAALARLLDDGGLRRRLGGALREKVERLYGVDVVVRQWEDLLDRVVAEHRAATPVPRPSLFQSFFLGGFESSTHRRRGDRQRLDMIARTAHDANAADDYRALAAHGILSVRDAVRWHLVEPAPGRFDWSSLDPLLDAAEATDTEVIWDLMHYGWPDDLDIWGPDFAPRFRDFAVAAADRIAGRTRGSLFLAPINEISFFAWAGGDAAYLNPFGERRAHELKVQLVRAAILACRAIRERHAPVRFVHVDPVINIVADPARPDDVGAAEGHRQAQYQAWDMIAGRAWPQLGGAPDLLDVVGVNYYWNNQWVHGGAPMDAGHPRHRPFGDILAEVFARYGRPILIAETGIEGDRRPEWLAHVAAEARGAMRRGVRLEGICLYPVLDHPGWDDGRYCANGLLGFDPASPIRTPFAPLAEALAREQARMDVRNARPRSRQA